MSNIVNLGVDFEKSNIIFVDGLTLERVRIYYQWLLNAKVKDVIIGEDDYGLVWYFGEWFCGEWIDGTWYSGIFHKGNWNNGRWFSYKLNKFDIINGEFNIENDAPEYSLFLNGLWINGTFNNGTFGKNNNEDWENYELFSDINSDYERLLVPNFRFIYDHSITKNLATWLNGVFNNGLIFDSIWGNGVFNTGNIYNSQWINGKFYFGVFEGHTWYNGSWYNGEFTLGKWMNGEFNKLDINKVSRFGINKTTELKTMCEWFNGEWKNGEWFSGYQKIGDIEFSVNNIISIWHGGNWYGGTWYGGHFEDGVWFSGTWKNGIFGQYQSTNWMTSNNIQEFVDADNYLYNNINFHLNTTGGTFSGITNINTYWDIQNQESELKSYKLEYLTKIGGWDSSTESISTNGVSGSTYNTTSIFIRDDITNSDITSYCNDIDSALGYVDSNNIYHSAQIYKKSDFTDCFNGDYILEIGGSGYTVSSITYHSGYTFEYNDSSQSVYVSGVTEILIFNTKSDWIPSTELSIVSNNDVKIYVKENINYLSGDGGKNNIDYTYLPFISIKSIAGKKVFISNVKPNDSFYPITTQQTCNNVSNFKEVYVNYNNGSEIIKILKILEQSGQYYIYTDLSLNQHININGKLISYDNYKKRAESNISSLMFNTFPDIQNFSISNIQGLEVKLSYDIIKYDNDEYDLDIVLPFNDLDFIKYTGSFQYSSDLNDINYDRYYLGSYSSNYVIGKKNETSLIGTKQYGSIWDTWELDDLPNYYNDGSYYNIYDINSIENNLNVSLQFNIDKLLSSDIKISDLKFKIYYKDSTIKAIWKNGIFERGLIINGDFKKGDISSSMIFNGDYTNINFGYDKDINRRK